jgi:cyanophycinase
MKFRLLPLAVLLFLVGCRYQSNNIGSRGTLLIIGGGEKPSKAIEKFIHLTGEGPILVIPSASGVPLESGPETVDLFREHGAEHVDWLFINSPEMANTDSVVDMVARARAVFFTGGVQGRLMDRVGDTRTDSVLQVLYFKKGGLIGGTSAGAAVQSEVMITGDGDFTVLVKDNIVTREGFGFLKNCIVDQHFVARQRNNRLLSLVIETGLAGIGIDEGTAILYNPDDTFDVIGDGSVLVYDPRKSAKSPDDNNRLAIQNLTLHVLRSGQIFDMNKGIIIKR